MYKFTLANMLTVLLAAVVTANALSLGKVSVPSPAHNVTKRESKPNSNLFPDWVPFKNKHGEELGEFVPIPKKPKKRLALPVNFVLRAVADADSDDYYERGLGDSEDNYENKDWSDLNRAVHKGNPKISLNHTDLSDIDGVVNIIVKPNPVSEVLKKAKTAEDKHIVDPHQNSDRFIVELEIDKTKEDSEEKTKEDNDDKTKFVKNPEDTRKQNKATKDKKDDDDNSDYEDAPTDNSKDRQNEEERRESEARKAKILSSVDDLKERHAEEQRILSLKLKDTEKTEKMKEEEMYKEELERDKVHTVHDLDKYRSAKSSNEGPAWIGKTGDYEDYVERETSEEKYKIIPMRRTTSTSTETPERTTVNIAKDKFASRYINKTGDTGKMSVFKNPRAYMIFDEDDSTLPPSTTTTTPRTKSARRKTKATTSGFTTGYTTRKFMPVTSTTHKDNGRISLVPDENDGKEGEPTLFFPKKRLHKKNKKNKKKNTTPAPDSSVAETVTDKKSKNYVNGSDVSGENRQETIMVLSKPSGPDSKASSSALKDTLAASTQQKAEPKNHNSHHESAGEKEHHSEHEEHHAESGKKAYEGVHKDTKTQAGHHDKEDHLGKYSDHGGHDKHHHDEREHYGAHNHEEHGKKQAKYEESGKHSKGHSTKGSHDIHKKEEYEKKVEFFEEEGDSAEEEKHGGHAQEREHSKYGQFKKGNLIADYAGRTKGDKGYFSGGGQTQVHRGHKSAAGHDNHGKRGHDQHQQGGGANGKKWIYHHGYPARAGNLVAIDRRSAVYDYGPEYYV